MQLVVTFKVNIVLKVVHLENMKIQKEKCIFSKKSSPTKSMENVTTIEYKKVNLVIFRPTSSATIQRLHNHASNIFPLSG